MIWRPKIIVVTGSSGKTTLLHLIESQIGDQARYSHHANSAYGIPFDILGIRRKKLVISEWFSLFFLAPILAFKKPYREAIYIVEVDCDRPGEGEFLGSFLKPAITAWINTGKTHSANFDRLVENSKFSSTEQAIAYEFGYLIQHTTTLAIINGDIQMEIDQLSRFDGKVEIVKNSQLEDYQVIRNGTVFIINNERYQINQLLPKEFFYSIAMTKILVNYLGAKFDPSFPNFSLPPGRSSVLNGVKNTTIIDSSYNATPDGMRTMIEMFGLYSAEHKWLVLGDMIELGSDEQAEHERLSEYINKISCDRIVLVGPRISKYTYPKLKTLITHPDNVVKFDLPKSALSYIVNGLRGEEVILFKGARFLEGIIEQLLVDKNDASKLCRREKIWQIRRKKWGL